MCYDNRPIQRQSRQPDRTILNVGEEAQNEECHEYTVGCVLELHVHVEADLLDDVGDAYMMKVKYSKTPTKH